MEDFQYVVERKKPERVCFGSAVKRDTNPIGKGLSPFQRRYASEIFVKVTPQSYNVQEITSGLARLQNKVRSNKGVGGLSNKAPRFPHRLRNQMPSPTRYDPEPISKTFEQSKVPFGKSMPRKEKRRFTPPAVGTYDATLKHCMRTKFAYNFGRPKMLPTVELFCTASPPDVCDRCGSVCRDDYWHKNYITFLCHICMEEEKVLHEDYTKAQLKQFKKIRICSYMHDHEGVTAATSLLPTDKLRKRERLENYLSVFITSI